MFTFILCFLYILHFLIFHRLIIVIYQFVITMTNHLWSVVVFCWTPPAFAQAYLLSAMLSHGDILLVSSFLTAPVTNGHQHARRADSWPYVIEHVHEMVRDRYGNRQMRAEVNYENNTYDINELKKYVNVRRSETIWMSKPKGRNWNEKSASFYIIMYFFTYNLKYESLPLGGSDLNFFI